MFESKVMAIEENNNYKNMNPSEVIGRLLTYESRKATTLPPKKKKNFSLKTSKVEKEDDDSDEDMALLAKRFKKFLKLQKNGFKKVEPIQENSSIKGIQCLNVEDLGTSLWKKL